jgi:hypothetical protein
MARLGGFSTEKAAQDYGVSRQVAANRFRQQETEAANQALEEQLQKIQDEASKKSKRGGDFKVNLLKGLAYGAFGPLGAAFQLADSIYTGVKTDQDYKGYIDDLRELAELDPDVMKRFKGTPLEAILANAVGQASMEGEQFLQGARGAAKTGNILDAVLSGISLGGQLKSIPKLQTETPVVPLAPSKPSNFNKALNKGTDALDGLLQVFGGKKGGKVLSDAANLVTKPISTGIQSPKVLQPLAGKTLNINPYSLLRAGKSPLIDYLVGQPGDISFNEIDAPRRRIR